jgi:hypothetical protein
MASIFEKQGRLSHRQLVTVAQRRFQDAEALCDTERNARANGAQYLCGFVVEILLKAQLILRNPTVAARRSQARMSDDERETWSLIFRSHDLSEMLARLPDLKKKIENHGRRTGKPLLEELLEICSTWTIYARYSTLTTTMQDARRFLERVRGLKEVLK